MSSPPSLRYSTESVLLKAYGDDEGEDGDDQGREHGRRGGDEDEGREHGRRGGDEDDQGEDEDDDRGEHHVRKFFNFKQLERDDENKEDREKESAEPKPKTYDGYNFEKDGDKKSKEFNFAAVADFGCSKNAKKTINNIEEKKPEVVLALGDLSVDETADCWFDEMSPLKGKIMITLGYHDVNGGKSKMNQYIKSFDLDKHYYSFNYRHVHFIVMSTLSKFDNSSDQYEFIEKDLKKASENEDIDWIVVTNYGPFYTSPSKHPAKNDIRNIYHPLFDRYGVDLVLNGHNHNYQRTYPVTFNPDKASNPIVTNILTTGYNGSNDGIVYAIVGTAGEGFHPLEGRQSYVATQFEGKFGFLDVKISNGNPHTNLTGMFYDNKGSNVTDYFSIEKEIKNTDVDLESEPPSVSHISQNSNSNHDYLPSCNYCDK